MERKRAAERRRSQRIELLAQLEATVQAADDEQARRERLVQVAHCGRHLQHARVAGAPRLFVFFQLRAEYVGEELALVAGFTFGQLAHLELN